MAHEEFPARFDELGRLIDEAIQLVSSGHGALSEAAAASVRITLAKVEAGTPGGAPLHAQLDTVRKWVDLLEHPDQHERFGGTAHVRAYALTQLGQAGGALDDYRREMT
jgi:hypothetical protein